MAVDPQEFPDGDLTPQERRYLRSLIQSDKRAKWAMSWVRNVLQYLAAVIIAGGAVWSFLRDSIKNAVN